MVAFTAPDCLPYFECSDSPCLNTGTVCEPSTVWCDLTAVLESKLNAFDSVVARTATAVPFAKVAMNTPAQYVITGGSLPDLSIRWDTVLADNNNLVNLDLEDRFIRLNRAGVWWFELYANGDAFQVDVSFAAQLVTGSGSILATSSTRWRTASQNVQVRAATGMEVTAANLAALGTVDVGANILELSGAAGTITLDYAELTAYWTAEEII